MNIKQFKVSKPKSFCLLDYETKAEDLIFSDAGVKELLQNNVFKLSKLHDKMWAEDKYGLLVIFQSMDAGGKDGAIRHVMSGFKPQGTKVTNFDKPTYAEYDHDFFWRATIQLPRRGHIGIFNRSYYEEVLAARVHNLISVQRIPEALVSEDIWQKRFRQIRNYERTLFENGMIIIKIFLHISKEEQKQRLLSRVENKSKMWKFSVADMRDRDYWELYQEYYDVCIRETASPKAPWYIVPADDKKTARYIVSEILVKTMQKYKFKYPVLNEEQRKKVEQCRLKMLNEE